MKSKAPPKTGVEVAKQALGNELSRIAGQLYEIEQAEKKRPALLVELKRVKAALAALSPEAPAAKKPRPAKPAEPVDRKERIVEAMKRGLAKADRDTKPANVTPTAPVAGRPGRDVTDAQFISVWNASDRASSVSAHFGMKGRWATQRAVRLRATGVKLKVLATGRPPRAKEAKAKPAKDAEERPVQLESTPVGPPEPTPVVKLDIKPRPSAFRPFARAAAAGEVVKKPKVHHVPIEVAGGQVYGHWRVVIETVGERGQRAALVRSTCEAKTERRVSVSELVSLKLPAHCKACKPKRAAGWRPESRTAAHAASLAKRQARAASGGEKMPETYRCTVTDQGHPCGSLVFAKQRRAHLQDVHALDGTDAEVVEGFTGPVDTRANEKEAA